jgi:hypothetical protein
LPGAGRKFAHGKVRSGRGLSWFKRWLVRDELSRNIQNRMPKRGLAANLRGAMRRWSFHECVAVPQGFFHAVFPGDS